MKIILNDKTYEIEEGTTLASFTENLGISPNGIAIALNYEVIPKNDWKTTVLKDGMELMMIHAVSGG